MKLWIYKFGFFMDHLGLITSSNFEEKNCGK